MVESFFKCANEFKLTSANIVAFHFSEFCSIVRKIFIYSTDEVKTLSPKIRLPVDQEVKLCKPDFEGLVGSEDQSSSVGPSF